MVEVEERNKKNVGAVKSIHKQEAKAEKISNPER